MASHYRLRMPDGKLIERDIVERPESVLVLPVGQEQNVMLIEEYDLGAVSYLALLNAQQVYQQAIIGRTQALMNRFADTAALYAAVGGAAPTSAP